MFASRIASFLLFAAFLIVASANTEYSADMDSQYLTFTTPVTISGSVTNSVFTIAGTTAILSGVFNSTTIMSYPGSTIIASGSFVEWTYLSLGQGTHEISGSFANSQIGVNRNSVVVVSTSDLSSADFYCQDGFNLTFTSEATIKSVSLSNMAYPPATAALGTLTTKQETTIDTLIFSYGIIDCEAPLTINVGAIEGIDGCTQPAFTPSCDYSVLASLN